MKEWKLIHETNNRYSISNYGEVKKRYETIIRSNGRRQIINERVLIPTPNVYGYLKVRCNIEIGVVKNIYIHPLVCKYFCDGYFIGAQVNHKDGDKLNNNHTNLEWVTCKKNIHHAWENKLSTNNHAKKSITVDGINFDSYIEASNYIGINRGTFSKAINNGYYIKSTPTVNDHKFIIQ